MVPCSSLSGPLFRVLPQSHVLAATPGQRGSLFGSSSRELHSKVNRYLRKMTNCSHAFILTAEQEDLACRVINDGAIEGRQDEVYVMAYGSQLIAVLQQRQPLNLNDVPQAARDELSTLIGVSLVTLLLVPIFHPTNADRLTLIACLANKGGGSEPSSDNATKEGSLQSGDYAFSDDDRVQVSECMTVVSPQLLRTMAWEEEKRLREECQSLLTVARNLFTHLDDVTLLLREIMTDARELTRAERCSLFLLDKEQRELVAKVFDGHLAEDGQETCTEVRIPANQGIAGHVATTGEVLNIRDAYNHPLFYRRMDEVTGFKTRNILCFPIKDDQEVIGVAELCNKVNGKCFSFFDEEMAKAFSIYCGISIMHSLMWKKVRDAQHRSRLSNELMMYHILVPDEEVHQLVTLIGQGPVPTPREKFHPAFETFQGIPRAIPDRDTPLAVVTMFEDLSFIQRWRVSRTTLARFVLMVRKGYRDPPYHNWTHAFAVAHYSYLLIKNLNLVTKGYLTDIEALSLFVACLCHDLDHRGTTNTFQVNSKSILASLYSSEGSVMERHHFAQAMAILNTDGCNIFENLDCHEYTKILDNMREIILATDLSHHFKIMPKLNEMVTSFKKDDVEHHQLLMSLLVTSCDLSDQTKDWKATKQVAELIYKEFFSQGDLEKSMGIAPDKMMDREKAFIPELQIQFIDGVVRPTFHLLAQLFPNDEGTHQSLQAVTDNLTFWQRFREIYLAKYGTQHGCSLSIFHDRQLEKEVVSSLQLQNNRKRNFREDSPGPASSSAS
ncbi:cGMP-dependent 3',5'-cyclic phosphodiesterase-like isoform X3 [Varroa destructor]|uniref:Phosphodiesterase n=1 Tax=Varroa destructor TaxID=109461 RepID=A0A7M7M353_VARDE|nr:cGMP-dependent 3',5'-cyclic phosphodiesterase-like isoform X3 [Varroa destructor]